MSAEGATTRLGLPDHLDRPLEAWKRKGGRLGLDCLARRGRKACPRLDPDRVLGPPPGAADLAVHEERARPHARRPETLPLVFAWEENLALGSVEQEVGIAARQ